MKFACNPDRLRNLFSKCFKKERNRGVIAAYTKVEQDGSHLSGPLDLGVDHVLGQLCARR